MHLYFKCNILTVKPMSSLINFQSLNTLGRVINLLRWISYLTYPEILENRVI